MLRLIQELLTVVPEPLSSFFFTNSGAEAVEGAIKLARHATKRPNIIVFQGSFHGSHQCHDGCDDVQDGLSGGLPAAGGRHVRRAVPYAYRYGWDEKTTLEFCLKELKLLLKSQTAPEETAAMLIEPVQAREGT